MPELDAHLVVVGSGIAGLYATLLAVEAGAGVTLLTKGRLAQSNTHHAQGGICAVLAEGEAAPGDSVRSHIDDTHKAGAGQHDVRAVRALCSEAAGDIAAIERFGVVFDRDVAGRRALGLEGAHSAARILHAGGDATGAAIADGLIRAVLEAAARGEVTVVEHAHVHQLLLGEGSVRGVSYQRRVDSGQRQEPSPIDLRSDGVLLATGGAGQLFSATTNPALATADGVALAWRAGAVLRDLEYFQFHPTALAVGENFLISEAVRGAGAVLRDAGGAAFMADYHPDADLAPRDVVSRSIAAHLNKGGDAETVFLDATGVEAQQGAGYLARRFPTIDATTRALGFDWTQEWLPIVPAAHYWMGGVATNLYGETSIPGLFAAGEVACTGVHGANRLASNSLLEGLVFGRRAVKGFMDRILMDESYTRAPNTQPPWTGPLGKKRRSVGRFTPGEGAAGPGGTAGTGATAAAPPFSREALQRLMSDHVGVVRDQAGLSHAAEVAAGWRSQLSAERRGPQLPDQESAEAWNLLDVAQVMIHAALHRENSVGAHCRSDFPQLPDASEDAHCWVHPGAQEATHQLQRESETV